MIYTARVVRVATATSSDGDEQPVAYLDNVHDASGASVVQVLCVEDVEGELRE